MKKKILALALMSALTCSLCACGGVPVVTEDIPEVEIYLLEAGAFGVVIPLILLAIGVVNVLYPSLICICVSFLMLVWLFLFKRKDMVREMQKKFRV